MRKCLVLTTFLLSLTGVASADLLSDIKARGTLVCGVFSGAEPFAFQDPATRELKGYDVDFCKGVAARLGVKPELKVVSLEARIPELQQGRIDVLAAVLGYNPARGEQIAFSDSYFVSRQVAITKSGGIKRLEELSNKRISTVKGSSNIPMVQKALPTATIVSFEDAPAAFMALVQDKVDGHVLSEAAMRQFTKKLGPAASDIVVLEPAVSTEYWGLGMRKGEPAMEKAVNDALVDMDKTGEVDKIFGRWMATGAGPALKRSFAIAPIPR